MGNPPLNELEVAAEYSNHIETEFVKKLLV